MNNYKELFFNLEDVTYLYTGAQAPALMDSTLALTRYLSDKSLGDKGREKASIVEQQVKKNIATMIGATEEEIAFLGNASEGINSLVEALNIQPGENIILNDLEYSSVYLPWTKRNIEGDIDLRLVKSKDGRVEHYDIVEQIDENTRLVAISHTSYINGFRHNMKMLRRITKEKNIPLLVDATQSLGAINVNSDDFDMMVSSSYKWLLGTHGLGILYVDKEFIKKLTPKRIGWRSVQSLFGDNRFNEYQLKTDARKFEVGWNNYPCLYVLKHSTDLLLELSIDKIEKHILDLGDYAVEELKKQGWPLLSSSIREERSGNISIPVREGEKMMKELERKNIKVWGGDKRIRISIHFFNSVEDIDHLINALSGYVPQKLTMER